MEQSLWLQGSRFLMAIAFGAVCGLHYDLLRELRRGRPRLTHLIDLWFVLTYGLGAALVTIYVGGGEYRIYLMVGTALGFLLWSATLGKPVRALNAAIRGGFQALFRWIRRGFAGFFKKILKNFKKHLFKLKKIGYNRKKQNI